MEVLKFINTYDDWEEILTQPPYSIIVKRDGDYILLKYNQLSSDFSLQIVRESRGAIFYQEPNGKYICVCRAFDKFGNYGESYVPEIDWKSAIVEEKVDGALIKFYYHNGWHFATNGTIDANKAAYDDCENTFGDLIREALVDEKNMSLLLSSLDKNYTYMFELISPKNKMTIYYPETKLYYLGQRNINTMQEDKSYTEQMNKCGVLTPKVYSLTTLEECLEYVKTMTKDQEGFVIRDKYFNRMKLKSPEFLLVFHMNNNGVVTTKRIIDMIKNEQIDDFLAYCPEYTEQVMEVINRIARLSDQLTVSWGYVDNLNALNRAEFANSIKSFREKDFFFKKYDNPDLEAMDYIMAHPTSKIKAMIGME